MLYPSELSTLKLYSMASQNKPKMTCRPEITAWDPLLFVRFWTPDYSKLPVTPWNPWRACLRRNFMTWAAS
jgi:hypothetical protein